MEIIRIENEENLRDMEPTVLVLGYFDGIHRGHQALFLRAREIADKKGLSVSVLTFPESPKLAFLRFSPNLLMHLTSHKKRYQLMEKAGVDRVILKDFTSDFSKYTAQEFVQKYVNGLNAQVVVTGFDYHFGTSREKAEELAYLFDGQVEIVDEVQFEGVKISSTRIRQAIFDGNIMLANELLGYPFSTEGIVVHGDARGRTIGYPTANLAPLERVYLPADGVYVADVEIKGKNYRAMASVGKNITFDGTELRLEAHIFEFEKDIYGEKIRIYWLDKIRDMMKFSGAEELMKQMKKDENISLHWAPRKDL